MFYLDEDGFRLLVLSRNDAKEAIESLLRNGWTFSIRPASPNTLVPGQSKNCRLCLERADTSGRNYLPKRKETEVNENTHSLSDLREQFLEWLESHEPDCLHEMDVRPVASLLDPLSDCGDVLPADYCDRLEIPKGSTYAEAVADVRKSKRRAPESEGLEPLAAGGFVIGYHSDINGPDADLVDFKPTRAELMTLSISTASGLR